MFEHPHFRVLDFADVPLDEELFLVDEKWMAPWEAAMIRMFEGGSYETVGYISWAIARSIGSSSIELSWYPNIHTPFHDVILSKNEFVACIACLEYDEKPHLFVKTK